MLKGVKERDRRKKTKREELEKNEWGLKIDLSSDKLKTFGKTKEFGQI